jgi:hypothetical protein
MFHRNGTGRLIFLCVLMCAAVAVADVPDTFNSFATTDATEQVAVYTRPDGFGDEARLDHARAFGGTTVDATIHVTLLDVNGVPVVGYPAADIWLETNLGGLVLCDNGSMADAPTDFFGRTTFSGPIYGGGASDPDAGEITVVKISGDALNGSDLNILFHSPDITGNLVVSLADLALFSQTFFGTYNFNADFLWNGVMNLADLALFAQAYGANCPGP